MGKVAIPIIAAGGLVTKEDIQKALESGAQAVQIGTALLVADECEISPLYKMLYWHRKNNKRRLRLHLLGSQQEV